MSFASQDIFRGIFWLVLAILLGLAAAFSPVSLLIAIGLLLLAATTFVSPIAALAFMLVLAPLRTLIATEAAIQTPLDIGQAAFIAFLGFWWFHRLLIRKNRLKLPNSPIFLSIAAFAIAVSLSAFSAISMTAWLSEWLKWITVLVLIAVIMDMGQARRWEGMVFALVASGIGNALVGLYIFFGGSGADHLIVEGRFFRAFGTFGQPNPFGGFLGLLLPLSIMATYSYLIRFWQTWRVQKQINLTISFNFGYYTIACLIIGAGLIASWSRGAWLGFVFSLAVMAFALPRKLWQNIGLAAFAGISIAIIWFSGVLPASIETRILSSTQELFAFNDVRGVDITSDNYAIVERLAHWQAALNMAWENPWLGVGFGNYEIAYADYRLINWKFALGHAHNYYLNILAEAGIIGLLFYGIMWFSVIFYTWKARSHPDLLTRSLAVGLMGTWSYLAFHSFLDNLYVNNIFLHLGVMLGLLSIFVKQIKHSIQ